MNTSLSKLLLLLVLTMPIVMATGFEYDNPRLPKINTAIVTSTSTSSNSSINSTLYVPYVGADKLVDLNDQILSFGSSTPILMYNDGDYHIDGNRQGIFLYLSDWKGIEIDSPFDISNVINMALHSINQAGMITLSPNAVGTLGEVGSSLGYNISTKGNIGSGETQLVVYPIAAGTLEPTMLGQSVEGYEAGSFATSINNKQIRIRLQNATSSTIIYDSGACPITTSQEYSLEFSIIQASATTVKSKTTLSTATAATCVYVDVSSITLNTSRAFTINITGTGGSNNDIVHELSKISWSGTV